MLIGSVMPKRWIGVPQRHGCRYLNVLRQPADTLTVTLSHDNTAHEDLDGTNALERNLALAGSLVETKLVSELVLTDGTGVVNLVTKNQEGSLGEVLHGQKSIELSLALNETLGILGIDKEDNAGNLGEVILPQTSCLLVTAQVEGGEADVADAQLLRGRVEGRVQDGDSVVLEHVKKRGLSGIVETKEQQFSVLVHQAKVGENVPEPVDKPHLVGLLVIMC